MVMMVVVVMSVMMIDRVSCIPGWLTTPYVVKDDLELLILLPPPRKSWDRPCATMPSYQRGVFDERNTVSWELKVELFGRVHIWYA